MFVFASENDYSTSEKCIGTWIDGAKLYQKTFVLTLPTVTTNGVWAENNTPSGLSNVYIVDVRGFARNTNGGVKSFPCCRILTTTNKETIGIDAMVTANLEINLTCSILAFSEKTAYVTLKYTKTS